MKRLLLLAVVLTLSGCSCSGSSHAGAEPRGLVVNATRAPEFRAKDQTGAERTLAEFRGKLVVLYFYPRDATPGCTREACAFRDAWQRLEAAGAQVLGVSNDSVESHATFAREHSLPFPLLADTDEAIANAYGVGVTLGMVKRVTVIIDRNGIVARVFPNVDPAVHADEVIETLNALAAR